MGGQWLDSLKKKKEKGKTLLLLKDLMQINICTLSGCKLFIFG